MEKWDLYDENGNKIGKTINRGEKMEPNEYHISVHIWIINKKNEFLIQKRSANKKKFPNMWSMTGGAVLSGENSEQACIRETMEELGVELSYNEIKKIGTLKRENGLVDIWIAYKDFDEKRLKLQIDEVSEAKWVNISEIEELLKEKQFTPSVVQGLELCTRYLSNQNKN